MWFASSSAFKVTFGSVKVESTSVLTVCRKPPDSICVTMGELATSASVVSSRRKAWTSNRARLAAPAPEPRRRPN
jgi:hypothetical protein